MLGVCASILLVSTLENNPPPPKKLSIDSCSHSITPSATGTQIDPEHLVCPTSPPEARLPYLAALKVISERFEVRSGVHKRGRGQIKAL